MLALLEYLGSKTDETIKTLDELVRIQTQVPPGENYEKAMDYAASELKQLDFEVETLIMPAVCSRRKIPDLPTCMVSG